jgi:P-type Mg2+ transporter
VRTRRPFFRSRPSKLLALATLGLVVVAALTPYLPLASLLGFQTMPAHFYPILAFIIFAYIGAAETPKVLFYRKMQKRSHHGASAAIFEQQNTSGG